VIIDSGAQVKRLTPKKRILRMIEGSPIDRLPSDIWLSDKLADRLRAELCLDEQGLRELLDNHFVIIGPLDNHKSWEDPALFKLSLEHGCFQLDRDKGIIYDSWGVGWDTEHEGIYARYHPLSENPDLDKYQFPSATDPILYEPLASAVENLGDHYCIVGVQDLTLFERACALRSFENYLVDIKTDREYARELMNRITAYQIEVAECIAATGIQIAFTGGDYGTQQDLIISYDDWRDIELPGLIEIWNVYKQAGIPIMHHSCGNIVKVIPDLVDAGLDILNPIQHVMNPQPLIDMFGQKVVFFGGIDSQELIPFGTPERIRNEVLHYIDLFKNTRGYIIAPDQCLMSDVPTENILSLVETIREYA